MTVAIKEKWVRTGGRAGTLSLSSETVCCDTHVQGPFQTVVVFICDIRSCLAKYGRLGLPIVMMNCLFFNNTMYILLLVSSVRIFIFISFVYI